jgi:hypothetical protein
MEKYRKKPVVIEAVQFDGTKDNAEKIKEWTNATIHTSQDRSINNLYISTLEGVMTASTGDYIIKGVNGEFYPCKPDIFEKTYEKVIE